MLISSPLAHFTYDGSFEGLLCVVFALFERKLSPLSVKPYGKGTPSLFDENLHIPTEPDKAQRVWNAWVKKSNRKYARLAYLTYLSNKLQKEELICRYAQKLFSDKSGSFFKNMLDEDGYQLLQTARSVSREVHRFMGFVRFQKTIDGLFYSPIAPDNDILKLLAPHFCKRYNSQNWVIYDVNRDYGLFFDQKSLSEIKLKNPKMDVKSGNLTQEAKHLEEKLYDDLWQQYYQAVNIPERRNIRQMKRLLPVRYWRYLNEKRK